MDSTKKGNPEKFRCFNWHLEICICKKKQPIIFQTKRSWGMSQDSLQILSLKLTYPLKITPFRGENVSFRECNLKFSIKPLVKLTWLAMENGPYLKMVSPPKGILQPARFTFNHTVKLWDSREMLGKPSGNVGVLLPETNSSPLKMDGWNTSFLLGWPIFRGFCC